MTKPSLFLTEPPQYGYSIVLHGGAGTLDEASLRDEQRHAIHTALREALKCGEELLQADRNAVDAVEAVVVALENSAHFNAGYGACLTWDGDHELDAAIMDGRQLSCGAVTGARHVRNPIRAAHAVMDHSEHVLLSGKGADQFAERCGLEPVDNGYFTTDMRRRHWQSLHNGSTDANDNDLFRFGTVGAVARDRHGHLAAATSTGGITDKRWGRVGDSPIIGAGTLADNRSCAISCTGEGEKFMRHNVAHEISARVRLAGQSTATGVEQLLADQSVAQGGIIALQRDGRIVLGFNTRGMYRAWQLEQERANTAIEQEVLTHD